MDKHFKFVSGTATTKGHESKNSRPALFLAISIVWILILAMAPSLAWTQESDDYSGPFRAAENVCDSPLTCFLVWLEVHPGDSLLDKMGTFATSRNPHENDSWAVFLPLISNSTAEAYAVIGPEGGVIEVQNPTSALNGVKLEVPEGALDEPVGISINRALETPPVPGGYVTGSTAIELKPSGLHFDSPARLSVPSNGLTERIFYTYDSSEQVWHILNTNYQKESFLVLLDHFSIVNWLCRPIAGAVLCASFEPCTTVTYRINASTNNAPEYTEDQIEGAIKEAVQTWQNALGPRLTFQETDELGADITFFWSDTGFFSFVLAPYFDYEVAGVKDINLLGNILVKFNDTGDITWSANNNDYCPEISVEALALHEMGHALGLTHQCPDSDPNCTSCLDGPVMAPNTSSCTRACVDLQESDVSRVKELYSCKPRVVSTNPDDGETGVSRDLEWIAVEFSKEMMRGHSVSSFCSSEPCWSLSNATPTYWSSDNRTFYFSRNNANDLLDSRASYEFVLNPQTHGLWFRDLSGNTLDTYSFSFSTE